MPNELIREVNRSYYCADVYEYPATFYETAGRTFLVHCPLSYRRLDFGDVETEEIITIHPDRDQQGFFHSRLEISPNGKFLISRGWVWHPLDVIPIYNIEDCINNPLLLDVTTDVQIEEDAYVENDEKEYGSTFEFSLASFLSNDLLLAVPSQGNSSLYWWDMNANKMIHNVGTEEQLGNLIAINEYWAWDVFRYPKLINLKTGRTEWANLGINSGEQNSSIIGHLQLPSIAWSAKMGKLAITGENKVEILSLCPCKI